MAIVNDTTSRGYQLPNAGNKLKDDVPRLRASFTAIDADIVALLQSVSLRAMAEHSHEFTDIPGLTEALEGKAAFNHIHALDDLSDVSTAGAANGQVLIRQGSQWVPANFAISNIANLGATLDTLALGLTSKAPLESAALTGTPTAPNPAAGDNSTRIATTGFVAAALALLRGSVGAAWDTLEELAYGIVRRVAVDQAQAFSNAEKAQARSNIDAVSKLGDTFTGGITINTASGQDGKITAHSGGSLRLNWGKESTADAAGNGGSNFVIDLFDNAGAYIKRGMAIYRASGIVQFFGSVGIGTFPSGLLNNGKGLALGDDDSGIRQNGDGVIEIVTNGVVVGKFNGLMISANVNGWARMANGLILQWGVASVGGTQQGTINFPMSFPNGCGGAFPVLDHSNTGAIMVANPSALNNNGFNYTKYAEGNGNNFFVPGEAIRWFAIGF